jgi:hypothetical protein
MDIIKSECENKNSLIIHLFVEPPPSAGKPTFCWQVIFLQRQTLNILVKIKPLKRFQLLACLSGSATAKAVAEWEKVILKNILTPGRAESKVLKIFYKFINCVFTF